MPEIENDAARSGTFLRSRAGRPTGVIPRNAQAMMIVGISAVMVAAIAFSGPRARPPRSRRPCPIQESRIRTRHASQSIGLVSTRKRASSRRNRLRLSRPDGSSRTLPRLDPKRPRACRRLERGRRPPLRTTALRTTVAGAYISHCSRPTLRSATAKTTCGRHRRCPNLAMIQGTSIQGQRSLCPCLLKSPIGLTTTPRLRRIWSCVRTMILMLIPTGPPLTRLFRAVGRTRVRIPGPCRTRNTACLRERCSKPS